MSKMNSATRTQPGFSQQGGCFEYDVLVIGTGLGGLHYCHQLLAINPNIQIALISKTESTECNSLYAQGGIAAALTNEDSIASHIQDTLAAGDGLCYAPSVEAIIAQGPQAVQELQAYPLQFRKQDNNEYVLAQEGGHSHRRILNCGDQTGYNLIQALTSTTRQEPNIHFFEHHIAINLISQYHPHRTSNQGEVLGAYILDIKQNKIHTFLSRCVVLATGGSGKTYRYTTNPMVATGDGVAMAYRAGARVGNIEFYQFHPTLLYHHTLNNFLISEAVRGEGALLKNADTHERFMSRYAPDAMELATRDVVSRAIFNEIEHSENRFVYLDITHQPKSFLQKRFPKIYTTLASIGIDMSQDMIPVVPAAHYQCGGVLTDVNGQTDLQRLYAIGEVAFTGLHGANRLASNSLLEAVVMASNAAKKSIQDIATPIKALQAIPNWNSPTEVNARRASQINAHWRSLRGEMTSYAGIIRTEDGLNDVLELIKQRHHIIEEYYWRHAITPDFIELRNIVLIAELIVRSALSRRESRGGHFREDFPGKRPFAEESIASINWHNHS